MTVLNVLSGVSLIKASLGKTVHRVESSIQLKRNVMVNVLSKGFYHSTLNSDSDRLSSKFYTHLHKLTYLHQMI